MHPGNIPAEPDKPRQDPGGTGKKYSKIWSGRVRGASRIDPGRFRNTPERTKRPKIGKVSSKNKRRVAPEWFFANFGLRPGPQNRQKMSPGTKKCVRKRRRKRFLSFFCRFRLESLSGPIFGGSDPRKSYYFLGGSAILTKSPFSKKTPKKQPPGTRFGTENDEKSTPGRAEIAKK